ncbi:MAG: type II toxin-antitoxin system HicB family antitoxin [Candidatus Omnitrophota bacterium]|nr:MAG: type II toxin-antitoxin system HicB family antitoxin [Candidatus Omnitrophota bacterium]
MIQAYLNASLKRAHYKMLDHGEWFVEIPGFEGVWASGDTVEECRSELLEVLEEWLILKIHDGDEIPIVDGIEIKVKHEKVA